MPSPHAAMVPAYTRNLVRLYRDAATQADIETGMAWYPDATAIMREWAETYGLPLARVASVTAALSPQLEWSRNLVIADDVMAGRDPSIGGALFTNIHKAIQIRNGSTIAQEFKQAPKVASFAVNLAGDYENAITVDTHASQAAMADPRSTARLTVPAYAAFADAYRSAAHEVGYPPAYFQAILWHTWKRLYPAAQKRAIRRIW